MKQRVVGIIQARMGSTRLPGKALADIAGRPMLWHVASRVRASAQIDEVIVAATVAMADDALQRFCLSEDIRCCRGSEEDVLDRYYHAARDVSADVIMRITSDCPLHDPAVIDLVAGRFLGGELDYVTNTDPPTFPDGLDVEAISFEALARAWKDARWQSEREHVTPFIRNHKELFRCANVVNDQDLSALRWTVDEVADLEFVRAVYRLLGDRPFGMLEVLAVLRAQPELLNLNAGMARNAGYAKSLREDREI